MPNTDKISVPLGRAGVYYNTDWISLTSLFSYISKTNNNSTLNPQKLAGQCAKLKCCLNYEVDCYVEAQKRLPSREIELYRIMTTKPQELKKKEDE